MALERHHRIALVRRALTDIAPWMRVDIRKYAKSAPLAEFPERRMASRVENDGATVVGCRVEVVIANKRGHTAGVAVLRGQQECSAFIAAVSPAAQLKDQLPPEPDGHGYAWL